MKYRRATLVALGLTGLTACGVPAATGGPDEAPDKVFVCKYVSTPGGDRELLQTGQNPISVSINSLVEDGEVSIGDEFEDAQGLSIVIAFDDGENDPGIGDCPGFVPATTTTGVAPPPPPASTTTTTSPSTTTTTAAATTTTTQAVPPPPPSPTTTAAPRTPPVTPTTTTTTPEFTPDDLPGTR
jgi:hypothetical protein